MTIDCETEQPREFPQVLRIREHTLRADVTADVGSNDSAPGARLRGVLEDREPLGPPARVPRVRARGLLRLVAQQARHRAFSRDEAPDHGVGGAG